MLSVRSFRIVGRRALIEGCKASMPTTWGLESFEVQGFVFGLRGRFETV